MIAYLLALLRLTKDVLHRAAFLAIVVFAIGAVVALIGSVAGWWPWLGLTLTWGDTAIPQAGAWVQGAVALLGLVLVFYLPANARILALELGHRRFDMTMEDIARAYHVAHAGDRGQTFRVASEFDAVRERQAYLLRHPDLDRLEPEVLDLAAKMSFVSRDLAEVYSNDNMDRARQFLRQRHEEISRFSRRLDAARTAMTELQSYKQTVEKDEAKASRMLDQLRADLTELAPELFAPPPRSQIIARAMVSQMRQSMPTAQETARPAE